MMRTTYKIEPGDTLSTIAKKLGTTVSALTSANGIKNPNFIIAGKTLNIPNSSVTVADKAGGGSRGASSNSTPGYTYTPLEYGAFSESGETKGAKDSLTNANNALTNLGDFNWVDQGKYDQLIKDYENRGKFSYDFNTDALYQQYKDKYIKQAKMASADVMGQAAAMTGGYGSSYAQTVGNQAYQANLEQLNDVIPELYQLAYDKYNQEGQDMLNMISLLRGERDFTYGQHNDEYSKLANDRDYWSNMYNNLYNRDYTQYTGDRNLAQTNHNNEESYKQWQKNYNLSERELKMAEEAWELEKKEYNQVVNSTPAQTAQPQKTKQPAKEPDIKPTKTKATTSFIANHQTKDEYMRRNKSYKEFLAYIDAEISKNQDNYSDEELMYLKQYYGL